MKYGILFLLFFYGLGKLSAQGNANAIVGVWLSENKRLKVEVYESNKKYFGKMKSKIRYKKSGSGKKKPTANWIAGIKRF